MPEAGNERHLQYTVILVIAANFVCRATILGYMAHGQLHFPQTPSPAVDLYVDSFIVSNHFGHMVWSPCGLLCKSSNHCSIPLGEGQVAPSLLLRQALFAEELRSKD